MYTVGRAEQGLRMDVDAAFQVGFAATLKATNVGGQDLVGVHVVECSVGNLRRVCWGIE